MIDQFSEADSSELEVSSDQQDELFDVLSHARRRFTLQYLRTADTPLPVAELAAELLSWEGQQTESGDSEDDAIEISLVHSHLPKMAEAGLVSYDATGQMVAPGDQTDQMRSHLRTMIN